MKRRPWLVLVVLLLVAAWLFVYLYPNGSPIEPQVQDASDDDASRVPPARQPASQAVNAAAAVSPERTTCDDSDSADAVAGFEVRFNRYRTEMEDIAARLALSEDAEHLLVAALLRHNPQSGDALTMLGRAWNSNPRHPLIVWNMIADCARDPANKMCADEAIVGNALTVDGQNGALWANFAAIRATLGDDAAALSALRTANTAPLFDEYWVDHVMLIERGLAAATDYSYADRISYAISVTAANQAGVTAAFDACRRQMETSVEWQYACLDYARRLESDSGTLLSIVRGQDLQSVIYAMIGETKLADEATARRESLLAELLGPMTAADQALQNNPLLMADYINQLAAHGEINAIRFLQQEARRLQQLPDFDPCLYR